MRGVGELLTESLCSLVLVASLVQIESHRWQLRLVNNRSIVSQHQGTVLVHFQHQSLGL